MSQFKNSFGDIRFWIVLFFILRLYSITDPPLEVAHNWRQTTVTMAARNFYETDNSVFFPRIDIAGEKSGITGMEFPALNYLIYLVSLIFGYAHWYGRLINLAISSLGIFYFYKLISKYFNPSLAFKASILLIFSVWFNYSRKIMPDTFSMSFLLAGMYYGTDYLDRKGNFLNLMLFFLLTLLGVLSKLPSAYLLAMFVFFMMNKEIVFQKKVIFVTVSGSLIALVFTYYFYWVPYLSDTYKFDHFFMGKSFLQGAIETFQNLDLVSEKFYLEALQIIGFGAFIAGLILAFIKGDKKLLAVFGISFFMFLLIIFKAGFVFYHHSYYIIPFAPVMALVAAYAIEQITNKKLALYLLILIALENVLNKFNDYQIREESKGILFLERDLDKFSKRKDLVLINSKNVPTPMYFAHRKGWLDSNENISQRLFVEDLKRKGLKYIIILKRVFGKNIALDYKVMSDNADYTIYKL